MSDFSGSDALTRVETVDTILDESKMYSTEWLDGASFGFTVTPVKTDRGTVLLLTRRTTARENLEKTGLHEVVPGDMLVAIGSEKVYRMGADNATKYLRSVQKPVQLTFQLSPYGNTDERIPDLAPNEFNYLWEDGPLGIVFSREESSHLPVVKRLTAKQGSPVLETDVQVGDYLVYANEVAACEYSLDAIIQIIKNMQKPILLRFRKPLDNDQHTKLPELAEDEYDFLWEYGPLGLVVGQSKDGLAFIRSFTGKGTSPQLGLVQENDEIVMVNDRSCKDMGFTETMTFLMNCPKPAVIRFQRKKLRKSRTSSVASNTSGNGSVSQYTNGNMNLGNNPPTVVLPNKTQYSSKPMRNNMQQSNSPQGQNRRSSDVSQTNASFRKASLSSNPSQSKHQMQPQQSMQNYGHSNSHPQDDQFTIDPECFYQIQWTDGPFGFTVREGSSSRGSVMLVTKRTGKATCSGLRRVAAGDILIKIGDKAVGDLGFEQGTRYLRTVHKPVVLTFQAID